MATGDDELSPGLQHSTLEEENAEPDEQLDELERKLLGDGVDKSVMGGSSPFFNPNLHNGPGDRYGEKMVQKGARELTLENGDEHTDEAAADAANEEAEYAVLLESTVMTSSRPENTAVNPLH